MILTNVYHVTYDGQIKGVLPLLPGLEHQFKAAHLPANPTLADKHPELPFSEAGWYVYFHDGSGAIACFRLGDL